jgi:DNA polymerase III sliding clamp (beta) subunit (PCNA family)
VLFNHKELNGALTWANKFADKESNAITIAPVEGGAQVCFSGLLRGSVVVNATEKGEDVFICPALPLLAAVRACKGSVEITQSETKIQVRSGGAIFHIAKLPAELGSPAKDKLVCEEEIFSFEFSTIQELFRVLRTFSASDDNRPHLSGIQLCKYGDAGVGVASDGFAIALLRMEGLPKTNVFVPANLVDAVLSMQPQPNTIRLLRSKTSVSFVTDSGGWIGGPRPESSFPAFESVMGLKRTWSFKCQAEDAKRALDVAMALSPKTAVLLARRPSGVLMRADTEHGSSEVALDVADNEGPETNTRLSGKLLKDTLSVCAGQIQVCGSERGNVIFINNKNEKRGFECVLATMR